MPWLKFIAQFHIVIVLLWFVTSYNAIFGFYIFKAMGTAVIQYIRWLHNKRWQAREKPTIWNNTKQIVGFSPVSYLVLCNHGYLHCLIHILITCVIARSNPRRLFSFYASSNRSHYHVTMTSLEWPTYNTWCHERKVRFLLKRQTSARTTPRTCAFNTLRDDRHAWTDRNVSQG